MFDYTNATLAYQVLEAPNTRDGNPRRLFVFNFDWKEEQRVFIHEGGFAGRPWIIRHREIVYGYESCGRTLELPHVKVNAAAYRDHVRAADKYGRWLPAFLATGKEA